MSKTKIIIVLGLIAIVTVIAGAVGKLNSNLAKDISIVLEKR